ncbi:hypothetical protein J3458_000811 [Metarhizium acridum]|uniref:uncharacterized protein n=1 Tax=Metarhizium acridum TaxID=92637 RepID=UPI001C6C277A|nr:hypothetical protein J3458_000811 [Metarhizium acridum]
MLRPGPQAVPEVGRPSSARVPAAAHDCHRRRRLHSRPDPAIFLKKPGSPNIPIQAIGLSLYESLGEDTEVEQIGKKVTRTQWLDLTALGQMENLVGKRILIVDEVDDTRTTLEYAVKELEKDVEAARQRMGGDHPKTEFCIFVLHNKDKPKKGVLPHDMIATRYEAAVTVGDAWINYPWEAIDIDEHDRNAEAKRGA